MKVLVADDDRVLGELLFSALRAYGCEVMLAQDAMQATMFAMQKSPDVIVLDINMPGGTGVGVLRKLKMSVKTMMIPVLVVTGRREPDLRAEVEALGASGFLQKPVDVDNLYKAICRLAGVPASSG